MTLEQIENNIDFASRRAEIFLKGYRLDLAEKWLDEKYKMEKLRKNILKKTE